MTPAEYWDGPPSLVRYYREAHRLKVEEDNQRAWIQGLYFKAALDASLSSIFGKGSRKGKYLEKPLELFPKSEKEKERDAEKERQKAVEYFNRLIRIQEERKKAQKGDEINGRDG